MIREVSYKNVEITDGFFAEKQKINREVSIYNVYKRFEETGRFEALKCNFDLQNKPHIFWDSDTAKWIEGAAYILQKHKDEKLWQLTDALITQIEKSQMQDGYFNSYFQVYERENIFKDRTAHELYCAGHMIEAAVALFDALGDDRLLKVMCKFVDLIYKVFFIEKSAEFFTPGHEEIELALLKLYRVSKNERHLRLAEYFIETRGRVDEKSYDFTYPAYHQSHMPVREQHTAEGHAVRALYLYTAMSDFAKINNDMDLKDVCEKLFENITNRRMYITGALGSAYHGEAFTFDYHLPNDFSYAETCAGIALCLFSDRMSNLENLIKYHDTFERAMYNNVLGGVSQNGLGYFYTNPHEMHKNLIDYNDSLKSKQNMPLAERVEVFGCSCCPPNVTRFIAQIGGFIYKTDDNTLYINQYISNNAYFSLNNNTDSKNNNAPNDGVAVKMKSGFPYDGVVEIAVESEKLENLCLRVPMWCDNFTLKINGEIQKCQQCEGYIHLKNVSGQKIAIDFNMNPKLVFANQNVWYNSGRTAVCYGPLVMCAESVDNDVLLSNITVKNTESCRVVKDDVFKIYLDAEYLDTNGELYTYIKPEKKKTKLTLVPYFAYANRGACDMQIWFLYDTAK